MKNLIHPNIESTDPDQLQFCLKISDTEFWYCEPNVFHPLLYADAKTPERGIYDTYTGYPRKLLTDVIAIDAVNKFAYNKSIWLHGTIDINDFNYKKKLELLESYGHDCNTFSNDTERNQIICEIYFEQNSLEFTHDY